MKPIDSWDHSKITQDVADKYQEWREMYGAPRTQSATLTMVEDVISPILDKLSSWERYEKAAQSVLEDIKNIIEVATTQSKGGN